MTTLPALEDVHEMADLAAADGRVQVRVVAEVADADGRGAALPVHVFTLGNPAPEVGALGVFGGVHGLERIGTEVASAFLRGLLQRLRWDTALEHLLERVRIVVMPLVNPGGMLRGTRANPLGVDLMRNAPHDAEGPVPMLLGGQRIGPTLPWYRGVAGAPMEVESAALCMTVERELLAHRFSIGVDCHSGFGLRDRLWFPYAGTARPIEHLPELMALAELMDGNLLHHRYLMEPQSRTYLAHGDLWDHLYRTAIARDGPVLLPLTLEMGSWLWVRKNPRQLLSRRGLFNPLIAHRQQRVLRRHLTLLDFLLRAAAGQGRWRPAAAQRDAWRQRALERWYAA